MCSFELALTLLPLGAREQQVDESWDPRLPRETQLPYTSQLLLGGYVRAGETVLCERPYSGLLGLLLIYQEKKRIKISSHIQKKRIKILS